MVPCGRIMAFIHQQSSVGEVGVVTFFVGSGDIFCWEWCHFLVGVVTFFEGSCDIFWCEW